MEKPGKGANLIVSNPVVFDAPINARQTFTFPKEFVPIKGGTRLTALIFLQYYDVEYRRRSNLVCPPSSTPFLDFENSLSSRLSSKMWWRGGYDSSDPADDYLWLSGPLCLDLQNSTDSQPSSSISCRIGYRSKVLNQKVCRWFRAHAILVPKAEVDMVCATTGGNLEAQVKLLANVINNYRVADWYSEPFYSMSKVSKTMLAKGVIVPTVCDNSNGGSASRNITVGPGIEYLQRRKDIYHSSSIVSISPALVNKGSDESIQLISSPRTDPNCPVASSSSDDGSEVQVHNSSVRSSSRSKRKPSISKDYVDIDSKMLQKSAKRPNPSRSSELKPISVELSGNNVSDTKKGGGPTLKSAPRSPGQGNFSGLYSNAFGQGPPPVISHISPSLMANSRDISYFTSGASPHTMNHIRSRTSSVNIDGQSEFPALGKISLGVPAVKNAQFSSSLSSYTQNHNMPSSGMEYNQSGSLTGPFSINATSTPYPALLNSQSMFPHSGPKSYDNGQLPSKYIHYYHSDNVGSSFDSAETVAKSEFSYMYSSTRKGDSSLDMLASAIGSLDNM